MFDLNYEKIKEELSGKLSKDRYIHTNAVAYTAACLAMKYDCDIHKAYLAGLLHDCAKWIKGDKYIEKANKAGLEINPSEYESPQLLHAKLGAYYAKENYNVCDEDILNAIKVHTTGKPDMNKLEMILYVADYIEPGRDKAIRLNEIRKIAFEDIELAVYMILEDTLNHIKSKEYALDPITEETYNFYKEKIDGRD